MRRSANPSKPVSLHQVEQMIRETETPEHSMSEQIAAKLESRSLPRQKPVFTRRAGVLAASLVAFCVFMTPVMAQAIERLNLLEYINPFAREVKTNPNEKVETIYARGLDGSKSFHTGLIRFDDIEDQAFKSQLQQAWTEIFSQGEEIEEVIIYEYKADTYHIEARNENRSAEFDQGQWTYAKQTIGESQVPGAAKAAADQAFHRVGELKQGTRSVSQMVLRPDQQPVYKFVYETNQGSVLIDVQQETNQITRVLAFPLSDHLDKLKDKKKYDDLVKRTQAIKLDTLQKEAVKQAKAWMKLDLADYNVSRDEFRFDTLIFTKAGAPAVTALFTSKGTIYGIERRW
ncbi:hypothetical protein [Paenibacillus piscarius]|uniref:hypothetical protein n=1 Tax=Paenibacillus piscarius TaxID=1089681 RepID=UPI001EE7BF72|nr:hypothetical protein [Paenibacillus piscarius]